MAGKKEENADLKVGATNGYRDQTRSERKYVRRRHFPAMQGFVTDGEG